MRSKAFLAVLVCTLPAYVYGADISMSEETLLNAQVAAPQGAPLSRSPVKEDFYGYEGAEEGGVPAEETGTPDKAIPKHRGAGAEVKDAATKVAHDEIVAPLVPEDDQYSGQHQAFPEIQMQAFVSTSDVNRIVCNDEIRDVVFSKDKGIKVKNKGKNLFVRFVYAKGSSGKPLYAKNPVEMFIVCGDNTFNLILTPKGIPAQTIRLDSGKAEKIRKNTSLFLGMPFEKKITSLIKSVYKDELPESFLVVKTDSEAKVYADIKTIIRRTVAVEGEGVLLTELVVIPVKDVELNEKMFNRVEFAKRPVAIAIERLRAKAGVPLRVFIVEKTQDEPPPQS